MLKRLLIVVAASIPPLVIVAMVFSAQSLWVPIPKDRYDDCFHAAKVSGNKHPDCRLYETIWQRGFVDPTAYYTLWLTLFTGVLASVGIAGGVFTWQQIRLARGEFNATHRPRLEIRSLRHSRDTGAGPDIFGFIVYNSGGSEASIVESNISFEFMSEPFPLEPPYSADRDSMGKPKIALGATHPVVWTIQLNASGMLQYDLGTDDPPNLFGYVIYEDSSETRRTTVFCRRWDDPSNRFVSVQNEEYERVD
jgi:hypothetical protein